MRLRIHSVPVIARQDSGLDLGFLQVSVLLQIAARGTEHPDPGRELPRSQIHRQMRAHSGGVLQGKENIVVARLLGPTGVELAVHPLHRAEQLQGLVDQVRAQVEQHPVARAGRGFPGFADLRRPALHPGLEPGHFTERALPQEFLHGLELAVPAPVLIDGEQSAGLFRVRDQFERLGAAGRERFVHHYCEPGVQRGVAQCHVTARRRRYDYCVEFAERQLPERADHPGAWVVLLRVRPAGRIRGDNRSQRQRRIGLDRGGVEDASGQAEADDGDPDHAAGPATRCRASGIRSAMAA